MRDVGPGLGTALLFGALLLVSQPAIAAEDGAHSAGDGSLRVHSHGGGHGGGEDQSSSGASGQHDHQGVHVVAADRVPALELRVGIDRAGRFMLLLDTEGFEFSEAHADGPHVGGEGHGHLYVDGAKIARIYQREHTLAKLAPGRHEVRVGLFTNDHRAYASDAGRVQASVILLVPRPDVETRPGEAIVHSIAVAAGRAMPVSARVEQGDLVGLVWKSDAARDLHLHGYDVELHVEAGGSAALYLVAHASGRFPVADHVSGGGSGGHGHHTVFHLEVYPR